MKNLFTAKSSDCSILLYYKLLRHIIGSEGIYVSGAVFVRMRKKQGIPIMFIKINAW